MPIVSVKIPGLNFCFSKDNKYCIRNKLYRSENNEYYLPLVMMFTKRTT